MGGHGGLNILPQKRWNVYGRENRLKVKRDEEQAAAEQAEKDALHRKAESEFRHALLLKRARAKSGAIESSADLQAMLTMPDAAALEAGDILKPGKESARAAAEAGSAVVPAAAPTAGTGGFSLVSFLQDDKGKQEHPEVADERRRESRSRGDEKTRTSDAKFDAQFAFGHGLAGDGNLPWYAKAGSSMAPDEPETQAQPLPTADESPKRRHKEQKKERKKERRKGHKKDRKRKDERLDDSSARALREQVLAKLRRDREEREAAEREKARRAVLEAAAAIDGGPVGKKYHGAYGNRRA